MIKQSLIIVVVFYSNLKTIINENFEYIYMSNDIEKKDLQVVVGLGISGLSAIDYLVKNGYNVAVTDNSVYPKLADELPKSVKLRKFGSIDEELLVNATRIIISPGISLDLPSVVKAKNKGIPIINDIQLFHEDIKKNNKNIPIVAITGSNGKSTVTSLVGEMAKSAGINVGVGGNIGVPALELLKNPDMELAVLELSSFQLESISNLNAHVATILNLSPDHLDRHGDMDTYKRMKQRIFQGVKSVVVNRDDLIEPLDTTIKSISFGIEILDSDSYGLIKYGGEIYLAKGNTKLLKTSKLKIKGQHNFINSLSAMAISELIGISHEEMIKALKNFSGLRHRCQFIKQINGVDYFNDSKGTNTVSTLSAIKGFGEAYSLSDDKSKLLVILGGKGKNQDFTDMVTLINKFVSNILFIGEDGDNIKKQLVMGGLESHVKCTSPKKLSEAVPLSYTICSNNPNIKAVILSPACASFDQYSGYPARGEHFIKLVNEL